MSNTLLHGGDSLNQWQHAQDAYSFIDDRLERDSQAHMLSEMSSKFQRYMVRSDRYGMMNSVEIRTPLLDPEIVKLCLNTPCQWKMHRRFMGTGYERKYILNQV